MSDTFFSGLYVVHKVFLTNCFDEELSELLAGEKIPRDEHLKGRMSSTDRYLSIGTRNRWFHLRMRELLRLSGIEGLEFLAGDAHTFLHKVATRHNGEVVWEETHAYTVLNPHYDKVISSINGLQQWCLSNPVAAADPLDCYPGDLANAFESAFYTLQPVNEGFDGGEGADFFFCVLRTVGDLMRYAKAGQRWAVYRTDAPGVEEEMEELGAGALL